MAPADMLLVVEDGDNLTFGSVDPARSAHGALNGPRIIGPDGCKLGCLERN
jgi:hypothetical protein